MEGEETGTFESTVERNVAALLPRAATRTRIKTKFLMDESTSEEEWDYLVSQLSDLQIDQKWKELFVESTSQHQERKKLEEKSPSPISNHVDLKGKATHLSIANEGFWSD